LALTESPKQVLLNWFWQNRLFSSKSKSFCESHACSTVEDWNW